MPDKGAQPNPAAAVSGWGKVARDVFAGTCGGIAVTLVGHPFDTAKVRLQTQSSKNPIYAGVFDVVKKTIQWEGPQGLYKGVQSPLVGQMFFRATLFGAFGWSKRWLSTNADGTTRPLTYADFYKAGAITGFLAAFTEGPIDFYKSQLQVQIIRNKADPNYKPPYLNMSGCVRATFRENGLRGPFQGLFPTILRNTPANSLYLGSFEVMKDYVAKYYGCETKELSVPVVGLTAGLGGFLYWVTIFPLDQVKSAMQADDIRPGHRQYPDTLTTARKLWADGGIPRFYKGFSPCLMRAIPANGVMLITVDKVTNWLS